MMRLFFRGAPCRPNPLLLKVPITEPISVQLGCIANNMVEDAQLWPWSESILVCHIVFCCLHHRCFVVQGANVLFCRAILKHQLLPSASIPLL